MRAGELETKRIPTPALNTDDVYQAIRDLILKHEIPPATKVNINAISRRLGVSATPVREALRLLQGDNLLVATSNKGYATTAVLDSAGVRDLFEFRLLVEPWAARSAAVNRLSNPGKDLLAEVKSFDPKAGSVQAVMINHDSRFHRRILSATENEIVMQAYEQSHCHLHLFRMFREDWDWKSSVEQHQEIANAISKADPDKAEQAMRKHLLSAYEGFMSFVGTQQSIRAAAGQSMIG